MAAAAEARAGTVAPGATVYPQQGACSWIGGQGTSPQEQNTQQSPGFGCSNSPQPVQS